MKIELINEVRKKTAEFFDQVGIVMSADEISKMEVCDFGLDDIYSTGLQIVTYINTERYCAKEMVLFPNQTCPEHRHAPLLDRGYAGKQETFRCRYGTVYLYVEGEETTGRACYPKKEELGCYTVFHEIKLEPGEQYTIDPDIRHWFSAGESGAVISEFSSTSFDAYDLFTDPDIVRVPTTE